MTCDFVMCSHITIIFSWTLPCLRRWKKSRGSATVVLLLQGSVRDIGELFHYLCNNCQLIYLFTIANIVPSFLKVTKLESVNETELNLSKSFPDVQSK